MNPTAETGATEFLANLSIGTIALVALVLTLARIALLRPAGPSTSAGAGQIPPFARSIAEILESLILAGVLVFLIIRPFFVQAFFIPSQSMEPTLLGHNTGDRDGDTQHNDTVHDHIFVNKLIYRLREPQFGDIVVFKAPRDADGESRMRGLPPQENVLIKRLIGLPGDTIEVRESTINWKGHREPASAVFRNGKQLDEPYTKEPMDLHQPDGAVFGVGKPLHLGPGQLFLMGDNRNDSNDSRYWGTLERSRVIGKAAVVFWPLKRVHALHLP